MFKKYLIMVTVIAITATLMISGNVLAEDLKAMGTEALIPAAEAKETAISTEAVIDTAALSQAAKTQATTSEDTELKYTLGPDDIIQIDVLRHPEFSGAYPINSEGKIQYKFVGDITAAGYTRKEFKDKLTKILATYIVNPDVEVTIMEYRSKVYYVVGEVGRPGKYYMRADSILVREAVVEAGLPTLASAMRRSKLITPDAKGKPKNKNIDMYSLLYEGNLKLNVEMKPGDVLYVPATMFAKIMRVISPVAAPVGPAQTIESAASGNTFGTATRRVR